MSDPIFTLHELKTFINQTESHKIHLIKIVRHITGASLKESKKFVEEIWIPALTHSPSNKTEIDLLMDNTNINERLSNLEQEVLALQQSLRSRQSINLFE